MAIPSLPEALLVVALLLVVMLAISLVHRWWTDRRIRKAAAEVAGLDRREGNREMLRLLDSLNTLDERYLAFTRRMAIVVGIVTTALLIGLGVQAYGLREVRRLADSNRQAVRDSCRAVEDVKKAVRDAVTNLLPPGPELDATLDKFREESCPHLRAAPGAK